MNHVVYYQTQNDCYQQGRTIEAVGLCWHTTGANNPYIKRYVGPDDGYLGVNQYGNHWNQPGVDKCVHGFIGLMQNGNVATYQTLPWGMRGWHCGSGSKGSGNNTHIGIEICESSSTDSDYFKKAYFECVEVSVYLCRLFKWDASNITDHRTLALQGLASNHGDIQSYFSKFGKSLDTLRNDVDAILKGDVSKMFQIAFGNFSTKEDAQKIVDMFSGFKIVESPETPTPSPKPINPYKEPTGIIKKSNSSNESTKWIQWQLINVQGISVGKKGVDGYYGEDTENAVKQLQKKAGIKQDGIVGPDTINALKI